MKKDIKWLLVKDEWRDIFQDLTPEQVGLITMKLYGMEVELPGLLNTIYKAMKSEFTEVNNSVQDRRQKNSEKAKKAAEARWAKEPDMLKHANASVSNANASVSNAKEPLSNAKEPLSNAIKEKKEKKRKEINKNNIKERNRNKDDTEKKIDYAKRAKELFQ